MPKPLTSDEVTRVSLVTRRECYAHRHWPEEVVRAFAAARVITNREAQEGRADHRPRLFRRVLSLAPFSA